MGNYADKVLQTEWNKNGADALSFEVLELLKEREDPNFDYANELKELEQIYRDLEGLTP